MTSSVRLAEPDYFTHPDWKFTLGGEVGEIARLAGLEPYPEQQMLLDAVFALDVDEPSRSAVFESAVICSRQQLKTGLLKQIALGWLYVMPQELVIWSAHEFGTAQEAFRDMESLISSSDDLSARVAHVRHTTGSEAIEMVDGSRLRFKARTAGGGRGLTGSKVILDEAFALQASHMGALLPTLISVPDPQVVYASSAGMASSQTLRGVRDRGRQGANRLMYAEWFAPKRDCASTVCDHLPGTAGCALDDIDLWRKSCPITARKDPERMQAIADLRAALPPEEFMRECLGWWDEPFGDSPINERVWATMLDADAVMTTPVVALDVAPDRSWSCIVAAGEFGDRMLVEITSRPGVFDHRPGTDWVVFRLAEMSRDLGGLAVYISANSAAESLVPDLESVGVPVIRFGSAEVIAACGRFFDMAVGGQLAHLGQDELTAAVTGARQKVLGDKAFTWVRSSSSGDLTPMYAATIAVWAAARNPVMSVW